MALTSSKRSTCTTTITNMVFNVLSITAVGDGVIDDSKAFKNTACNASCSSQIFLWGTAYNFQGALWIPSHLSGCVISMVIRWDFLFIYLFLFKPVDCFNDKKFTLLLGLIMRRLL